MHWRRALSCALDQHDDAATLARVRNFARSLGRGPYVATLLRTIADELDPPADLAAIVAPVDELARALAQAGHLVQGGWVRSAGAAAALGITEAALRQRRARGAHPPFVRDRGGLCWYALADLAVVTRA